MGRVYCAVVGCQNNSARLKKWKEQDCTFHVGLKLADCDCKPPFTLFCFPSSRLRKDDRKVWVDLMRRKNPDGSEWNPKGDDRVCSEHFLDGMPTYEHPYPEEQLGYYVIKRTSRVVVERVIPSSPPQKRPRRSESSY